MARTVLEIVVSAVDNFTAKFERMGGRAAKIGKKFEKVGKKATAALTLPILAIGAASIKAGAEFETGMSNVATLLDTNVESMEAMSAAVLDLATDADKAAVPLGEMTQALFDLRSGGISADDAMLTLENSAKLAVTALGTTGQAADFATSAAKSFGLEGEQLQAVFGQVFTATKFGKTTLAELSQGFGSVAGIVATNNIKLEEFLATTAALTTTGLKASEAYTQQKAILAGLTRQTEDTQKLFKELGVKDFGQLVKSSGGWNQALKDVASTMGILGVDGKRSRKAIKELGAADFSDLVEQAGSTEKAIAMLGAQIGRDDKTLLKALGSIEALNALLALTGPLAGDTETIMAGMGDEAEALAVGFNKQNATQAAQWQRTKNIMKAAGISISKILAPAVASVAKKLQALSKWFTGLDESTKEWIVTIAGVVATVGPVLLIAGKLLGAIGAISTAFGIMGTAIKFVSVLFAANPIGLAVAGIALAATLIITNWEPISEFFSDLWAGVVQTFEDALAVINDIADKIADAAERILGSAITAKIASVPTTTISALRKLVKSPEEQAEEERVEAGRQERIAAGLPTGIARLVEEIAGAPGQAGAPGPSGIVRVELTGVPEGARVSSEGTGIDLSVGRQLAGVQ